MTNHPDEITYLLEPVFIYFATPPHPVVRVRLTVTPRQGDEIDRPAT